MPTPALLAEVTRLYAGTHHTGRDKTAALHELFSSDQLRTPTGIPTDNLVELGEEFQKALIDYAPSYFEQKAAREAQLDAEQADLDREPTAAEQLEAITAAARSGEGVTAAQFAAARANAEAETELAKVVAEGAAKRADRAETTRRTQNKAKAAAKKNPPTVPAELDAAVSDAKAAIDRMRVAISDYRATIAIAAADFASAGIEAQTYNSTPSDNFDHDNYASDQGFIVIDGRAYGAQAITTHSLAAVVKYAEGRS